MEDSAAQGPYDPALWKLTTESANGGEVVPKERTEECTVFLIWFRACVQRGEWTSLYQATADIEEKGVVGPRLNVSQTTLSRRLKGEHLPRPGSLRAVVLALNIHIRTAQEKGELLFVQPVSDTELAEGLRLPRHGPARCSIRTLKNRLTEAERQLALARLGGTRAAVPAKSGAAAERMASSSPAARADSGRHGIRCTARARAGDRRRGCTGNAGHVGGRHAKRRTGPGSSAGGGPAPPPSHRPRRISDSRATHPPGRPGSP